MNAPASVTTASSAKRSAALFSVLAALLITALKLLTGLLTGSLGMLSEAAHSSIDLVAAFITLLSIRVADRPADEDHNYGHGKIESLSAFIETVLMLASSIWIVTEAVRRLFFREHLSLSLSAWPFVVLLLSIAVDFARARQLHRTAREHQSLALEADAVHFSTDIWSSAAVLLGLTATWLGERLHLTGLEIADPIAALAVSAIILRVTWRLARQTIDNLLDATPSHNADGSPANIRRDLHRELVAIDGVLSVDRLRVRQSGPSFFADLTLGMPRNLTFQRTEQITQAATAAVDRHLPGADVIIHSVPLASKAETIHDRVRAVASKANLAIHDLTLQKHADGLHLEQHLEVNETMPLRKAHDLVTDLEADIHKDIPEIRSILTHIESEPSTIAQPSSLERDRQLELRLRRLATTLPGILDIHDVLVSRMGGSQHHEFLIQVSCHCTLPDDLPMAKVHELITALESEFKRGSPEVARLLIHPEPATDNRR
jgi:cation diffusion facilitator family transporter